MSWSKRLVTSTTRGPISSGLPRLLTMAVRFLRLQMKAQVSLDEIPLVRSQQQRTRCNWRPSERQQLRQRASTVISHTWLTGNGGSRRSTSTGLPRAVIYWVLVGVEVPISTCCGSASCSEPEPRCVLFLPGTCEMTTLWLVEEARGRHRSRSRSRTEMSKWWMDRNIPPVPQHLGGSILTRPCKPES